jgi:hypothetical protein
MGKYYSREGKKATDYGLQKVKKNSIIVCRKVKDGTK